MTELRRRTVLKAIAALPLALRGGMARAEAPGSAGRAVVVLTGLTPELPAPVLRAAASPLLGGGTEVVIALDPSDFPGPGAVPQALITELRRLVSLGVDVIPLVPDLATARPYFQGRLGRGARESLQAFFSGAGAGDLASRPYATVATGPSALQVDAAGLRAAAFTRLLQLREGTTVPTVQRSADGVLTRGGGLGLGFGEISEKQLLVVDVAQGGAGPVVGLWFRNNDNAGDGGGLSKIDVERDSQRVADAIAAAANSRPVARLTDGDSAAGPASKPLLAVVVSGVSSADGAHGGSPVSAFAAALKAGGVPVHLQKASIGNTPSAVIAMAVPEDALPAQVPLNPTAQPGVAASGKVDLGLVHHADSAAAARAALRCGCDSILVVPAPALASEADRTALAAQIVQSCRGQGLRAVGLDDFARIVSPSDPVIRLRQRTERLAQATAPRRERHPDRDSLLADARLAWCYLTRFGVAHTGLCMATAQVDGAYVATYDKLAMWDVGSLLIGIRAAFRLGLIDREEFLGRVTRILAHLPRRRIAGLWLPVSLVDARKGQALERDFNTSDVGRLLSAFALLREEPELRVLIDRKLASWELAKTVSNNRLSEIRGGRSSEFYRSQGAHYAARAFAEFGMRAESPYPDRLDDSASDWTMRLLYAVAEIGALGPEPLLYEGLEMGFSRTSGYLADMLFRAQYRTHLETGLPVCPSASPIDRAPWFIEEGLLVGAAGDRWDLKPGDRAGQSRAGRRRSVPELASSKAAYLWAALHPHPYSEMLVQYVRDRGRIAGVGFASGIFVADGRATAGYSDLNTNAIILAALDHILGQMRPGCHRQGALPAAQE